mgnify:FL=1
MIAYYMDGEKLGELPVVTAEAVEKAGYIDQLQKLFGNGRVFAIRQHKEAVKMQEMTGKTFDGSGFIPL